MDKIKINQKEGCLAVEEIKRAIWVKVRFEAVHNWPECPIEEVKFLRVPHRHMFEVVVKVSVNHSDRQVEFIHFNHLVTDYLRQTFERKNIGRMSCEDIAEAIFKHLVTVYGITPLLISVSEDGENGAEIWQT